MLNHLQDAIFIFIPAVQRAALGLIDDDEYITTSDVISNTSTQSNITR